jgi:sugar phosphate isomerase/epimerase
MTSSALLIGWLGAMAVGIAGAADEAVPRLQNTFFVFCHDTHDAKKRDYAQQAEMISAIGFDGVGHLRLKDLPERLATLDEKGLKLVWLHEYVTIGPDAVSYDPALREALELLRGREVLLSLTIRGGKRSDPSYDDRVVPVLREIADLAATTGQRVVLYPHVNDWVETIGDAVRVARKVDRENLGAMFNLCHWLRVEYPGRLDETLKEAMPHLFAVSINGADPPPGGWEKLIQPLGSGSFDVAGLLRTLRRLGYNGPIGLMCYGLGGDAEVHLRKSMEAWKRLAVEAAWE